MFCLPLFAAKWLVERIAANDVRYSVRLFVNASEHFNFHQHTVPVNVTACQKVG